MTRNRKTATTLALLTALVAGGCAELPSTNAVAAGCTDRTNWFDRQRQLGDGNADPFAASIDAPCRVSGATPATPGLAIVEGARRS